MAYSRAIAWAVPVLLLLGMISSLHATLHLEHVDTLYLPVDGASEYGLDQGVAEQSAVDEANGHVYVVGENSRMYVVTISAGPAPSRKLLQGPPPGPSLELVTSVPLPLAATDIEICGDWVAVATEGEVKTAAGYVHIFPKYTGQVDYASVQTLTTGPLPDMIKFNGDCTVLVAANEGEAGADAQGSFTNPEGSVSIFKFASGDLSQAPTSMAHPDFTSFNVNCTDHVAAGVNWVYKGEGHTDMHPLNSCEWFSKDLEPEYVAFSADYMTAYVALQEANSIAIVDIASETITGVVPLGFKEWTMWGHTFDASNRDSGINFGSYPVTTIQMPDTIKSFSHGGSDYIVTANEGDSKEYEVDGWEWTDEERGGDMPEPSDDSDITADMLSDNAVLGRLKFTKSRGIDAASGKVDKFYNFGGRSFSIYKVAGSGMELVYDSGDDIEHMHAMMYPMAFNSEAGEADASTFDEMDSRSDDKGPETESLAIAMVGDARVLVVGNERTSTLMVYDITDPAKPVFHSMYSPSAGREKVLNGDLLAARAPGWFADPEDIHITSDGHLLVSGSVSGTLSLFRLVDVPDPLAAGTAHLTPKGQVYLPLDGKDGTTFEMDKGVAEQMAYHAGDKHIYVVGENSMMYVVALDAATAGLTVAHSQPLPLPATDVEVCGDFVAVATEGEVKTGAGFVHIFNKYDGTNVSAVQTLTTGPLPDMIKFNGDCSVLVAANEGEAGADAQGSFTNPEGSVSIFKFASGDLSQAPTSMAHPDFTSFNVNCTDHVAAGVNWVYKGEGHTDMHPLNSCEWFSKDLEPEYVAFSADYMTAYVALQEANSIAIVDIASETITGVVPLGFKEWTMWGHTFDASNRDSGINFGSYPVTTIQMPDTIKSFSHGGSDYIVTANEGDSKEYEVDGWEWTDEERGGDMPEPSDDSDITADMLSDNAVLGRLKFTKSRGIDAASGKVDKFYNFGGRSFSIYKVAGSGMELVYDSGDDIEHMHAKMYPMAFNAEAGEADASTFDEMDSRSDDKGPETESLAIAMVGDVRVLIVGNERTSTLMVYDITDPAKPVFHSMYSPSAGREKVLNGDLLAAKTMGWFADPEDIAIVEGNIVIVAGSVTGSLTTFTLDIVPAMGPPLTLTPKGSLFLPSDPSSCSTYEMDKGVAEQMAYHAGDKHIYVVGENSMMYVVALDTTTGAMTYAHVQAIPLPATDVEVCGDFVAVATEGEVKTGAGFVHIFNKYAGGYMTPVQTLTTGPLPDMIKFNGDCSVLVAANEGEAGADAQGSFTNPEGSVSIFKFASGDLSQAPTSMTHPDFTSFNDNCADHVAAGVNWVYKGEGHTDMHPLNSCEWFSKDLEPEYVAFSADYMTAYVALQEANSIAIVDIASETITGVVPLGFKEWTMWGHSFDASNRDSGINFGSYPVTTIQMPDTIKSFSHGGSDYIVTANEGDSKEYEVDGWEWTDEERGGDMPEPSDDSAVTADMLSDNAVLGRLKFTKSRGIDAASGKVDKFYNFGGRSFSIYKVAGSGMELVYDSGDDIEHMHAMMYPMAFNAEAGEADASTFDEMDSRSDDKGPETESLTIAMVGDARVLIVGNERTSTLMVYDITDPAKPVFHSMYSPSAGREKVLNGDLLAAETMGWFADPEDMFVTPEGMVVVAGSVTGSLTTFALTAGPGAEGAHTTRTCVPLSTPPPTPAPTAAPVSGGAATPSPTAAPTGAPTPAPAATVITRTDTVSGLPDGFATDTAAKASYADGVAAAVGEGATAVVTSVVTPAAAGRRLLQSTFDVTTDISLPMGASASAVTAASSSSLDIASRIVGTFPGAATTFVAGGAAAPPPPPPTTTTSGADGLDSSIVCALLAAIAIALAL